MAANEKEVKIRISGKVELCQSIQLLLACEPKSRQSFFENDEASKISYTCRRGRCNGRPDRGCRSGIFI